MNFFFGALFLCAHLFASGRLELEFLWPQIESIQNEGKLDSLIEQRILEIRSLNEAWRPLAVQEEERYPELFSKCFSLLQEGRLLLEPEGASAAYILYDSYEKPQFIIKPTDENIFCLHNPKHFASPFLEPRAKLHIPLYRAAQTDAFCYELAKACHLEHVTPKAVLSLLSHPQFFHIGKGPQKEEKLCSIQEYLSGTLSLRQVLEGFFTEGLLEEDLLQRFDPEDFEDVMLFLWLTFDNDAHTDNFLVYPKTKDPEGHVVYGMQKIDNSLAMPESNSGFANALMYFPNALLPISPRLQSHIHSIPLEEIKKLIGQFGLDSSLPAFEERISILQKLLEKEDITYYECSLRLSLLGKPDGLGLALSNQPLENLESLAKDEMRRIF